MKVCYTAIVGNYDILRDPLYVSEGWKYICFTTEDIKSEVWQVIKLPSINSIIDPRKAARSIKILPPFSLFTDLSFEYTHSLWVDANIQVIGDLNKLFKDKFDKDIVVMNHPDRQNISQELQACIKYRKDVEHILQKQLDKYRSEGYSCNELAATGILLRRKNNSVFRQAEIWKSEIINHSHRDQMSFNYSCWKCGITPSYFSYNETSGSTFKYYLHPHKERKRSK